MQRDLNLWQRWWIEYLEDHDIELQYHLKAYVMVDALSRKSYGSLAYFTIQEWEMLR